MIILIQGPVCTRSGYGILTRALYSCLNQIYKDDTIHIVSMRWGDCPYIDISPDMEEKILKAPLSQQPDLFFQVSVPNESMPVGKWNCIVTAGIETTKCAQQWIEGMNRMNLVLATSEHSKNVLTNSTATDKQNRIINTHVPVETLFIGLDYKKPKHLNATICNMLNSIPEKFLFLFVGHWIKGEIGHDRKNIGMLIKVFLETFKHTPTPPALLLKTSGATFSIADRIDILTKIDKIKRSIEIKENNVMPNIYLLHGDMTDNEMNSLYHHDKIKVMTTLTHGEGFDIPLLEASAAGKPIIASNWSGHLDFLHKDYVTLVPGKLERIHPSAVWKGMLIKDSEWFIPDYQKSSELFIDMYTNYNMYKPNALKQQMHVLNNYKMEKMKIKLEEILKRYVPEFPKEMKFNLPKLIPIVPINLEKIEMPVLKKIN